MKATLFDLDEYKTQATVKTHLIKDMPEEDRPVNRLRQYGPASLANAELLAIVLNTADGLFLAQRILNRSGDVRGLLRLTEHELSNYDGVGSKTALQIKAALELGKRANYPKPADADKIQSPEGAAAMLYPLLQHEEQEHFVCVLLNTRNVVIKIIKVFKGSANTVIIRTADIFRQAVRHGAVAIILAHNHPSGDPSPSAEDIATTRKLIEAGEALDIQVLDHVIIGDGRFVSLNERGLMKK